MAKYTMKDFISGKIAVHTGLDSQKFLELCDKHGLRWAHGDKATNWKPEKYDEDTCIVCEFNKLMHGPRFMFRLMMQRIVVKPEDIVEMTPKYTMKDFIEKRIAVRVGREHVKEFLKMCEAAGLKWMSGERAADYTPPDEYGADTAICYNFYSHRGELGYAYTAYYTDNGCETIDFTDIESEKKPKTHTILIDCVDGKTTRARMLEDGKTVKSTIARRNPADEFDFAIGAKVAFNRLFGKEPSAPVESAPEPKPTHEFKVGDRVKCIRPWSGNLRVKNARGTVKIVDDQQIGVEFDEDVGGHTLNKYAPQAKRGRGWWCFAEMLQHED